ncbi:class I SAM-dependent methyltransferase [Egibacter rhizosphaerae]|nr:class I SAM-dependent methyltransferase [Egibacter rhizosphaerae]
MGATESSSNVAAALLAVADGDLPAAIRTTRAAADRCPRSALAPALLAYLQRAASHGVYDEPSAFEGFIDGGSNPHLYDRAIAAVAAHHREVRPSSVLDIGCGDGRVTAAVAVPETRRVDLVEPSPPLLEHARERLAHVEAPATAHEQHVETFLQGDGRQRRWDLAQATFALHTLDPATRATVLAALAERVGRLLIVEFDVPDFEDGSVEHAAYAAARFESGVAEYRDHPEVVDGFLMPVLVGQFDPERTRHTHEQAAVEWEAQLRANGFRHLTVTRLTEFWWAPAVLLTAEP